MLESSGKASIDLMKYTTVNFIISLSLSLAYFMSISTGVSLVTPMSSISSLPSFDFAFSDASNVSGSLNY